MFAHFLGGLISRLNRLFEKKPLGSGVFFIKIIALMLILPKELI